MYKNHLLKKTIACFLLLMFYAAGVLNGQDIHFSNYYMSPLSLNPANTGNYKGNWRAMGNYRQQGEKMANSYTTATLAYDRPVYIRSEKASIGLIYIYDNSANNTLLVNKIYFSMGYLLRIAEKSYLHIGLQGGLVHKKFSHNQLTFPNQFDRNTGYFNPDISSQEYFEDQSLSYIDLNWGLIWSRKGPVLSTELGVAMFHYNLPEEVFIGRTNSLEARYQIHGVAKKKLLSNYYMKPQALYTFHSKSNEFLAGTDIGVKLAEQYAFHDFYVGAHYRGGFNRNSDALIFKLGFKYTDFDIALAYDLEISGQKVSNFTSNAFEISLIFTRPETKVFERTIPCDIF